VKGKDILDVGAPCIPYVEKGERGIGKMRK